MGCLAYTVDGEQQPKLDWLLFIFLNFCQGHYCNRKTPANWPVDCASQPERLALRCPSVAVASVGPAVEKPLSATCWGSTHLQDRSATSLPPTVRCTVQHVPLSWAPGKFGGGIIAARQEVESPCHVPARELRRALVPKHFQLVAPSTYCAVGHSSPRWLQSCALYRV